jgi:hypothetical protein
MLTKKFGLDAVERAVKTFAQSLIALIGVGAVNIVTLPWSDILAVSATAGVLSLLTSVVSLPLGDSGTASVVSAPTDG